MPWKKGDPNNPLAAIQARARQKMAANPNLCREEAVRMASKEWRAGILRVDPLKESGIRRVACRTRTKKSIAKRTARK